MCTYSEKLRAGSVAQQGLNMCKALGPCPGLTKKEREGKRGEDRRKRGAEGEGKGKKGKKEVIHSCKPSTSPHTEAIT